MGSVLYRHRQSYPSWDVASTLTNLYHWGHPSSNIHVSHNPMRSLQLETEMMFAEASIRRGDSLALIKLDISVIVGSTDVR